MTNIKYYYSATSKRTSLGLGSQNGFFTDQINAPGNTRFECILT